MNPARVSLALSLALVATNASAQNAQVGVPYKCTDGVSEMKVTNCAAGRCDIEAVKEGKPVPGIRLSQAGINQMIRQCVGPNAPNAPAAPPPAGARPPAPSAPPAPPTGNALPPSSDPGTNAARACVASGRSVTDCLGEAFRVSLRGTPLERPRPPASIRMVGDYKGASGMVVRFQAMAGEPSGAARVSWGCGFQPDTRKYTVEQGSAVVVRIENSPQPIALTLDAGGRLVGTATQEVLGQVVSGTRQVTETFADGRTQTSTVPAFESKTARCAIGALAATGTVTPEQTLAAPANFALQTFAGVTPEALQQAAQGKSFQVRPGPRALGSYQGQQGGAIEFRVDSASITCGEVVSAASYTLDWRGDAFLATIDNSPAPLVVTLRRDATLAGPPRATVAGRVVTGVSGSQVQYAQRTATCAFDLLRP